MLRARYKKSVLLISFGVLLGLVGGLALHFGLEWRSTNGSAPVLPLDELKLRAAASHGSETFAMATGAADENGEAVFMLDYLTGDLSCFVLHSRTNKFNAMFKTNVWKELPVEKGKKATYVMCTGSWSPLKGGANGQRPADCVVYIADCNTGYFAAYSFPWVSGASTNVGNPIQGPMVTLDFGKARDLKLRQ